VTSFTILGGDCGKHLQRGGYSLVSILDALDAFISKNEDVTMKLVLRHILPSFISHSFPSQKKTSFALIGRIFLLSALPMTFQSITLQMMKKTSPAILS
jgi:hypothetical protein